MIYCAGLELHALSSPTGTRYALGFRQQDPGWGSLSLMRLWNQGAKVATLFFDIFYPFMSYPQSAIANYYTAHYSQTSGIGLFLCYIHVAILPFSCAHNSRIVTKAFLGHALLVSVIISLTQEAFTRRAFYLFSFFRIQSCMSCCIITVMSTLLVHE